MDTTFKRIQLDPARHVQIKSLTPDVKILQPVNVEPRIVKLAVILSNLYIGIKLKNLNINIKWLSFAGLKINCFKLKRCRITALLREREKNWPLSHDEAWWSRNPFQSFSGKTMAAVYFTTTYTMQALQNSLSKWKASFLQ